MFNSIFEKEEIHGDNARGHVVIFKLVFHVLLYLDEVCQIFIHVIHIEKIACYIIKLDKLK